MNTREAASRPLVIRIALASLGAASLGAVPVRPSLEEALGEAVADEEGHQP